MTKATNTNTTIATDPILAAIEAHKAAIVARDLVFDRHSALDRELPVEKCHSVITTWEEIIVETDDPRWIACERALADAHDAEADAAIALVTVKPTTPGGLLAPLLQYAVTADTDGEMWLGLNLPDDESSECERFVASLPDRKPRHNSSRTW